MAKRKIVHIDEEKCNGCGLCVPSCAEGAIKIINGKAKLVADNLCDGLGACLGDCPQGAIEIIEREADEFDEEAVKIHLEGEESQGCPGSRIRMFKDEGTIAASINSEDIEIKIKSQLRQWPVQLMLIPPTAPYFQGADLLITADCVPFAYPNYHLDLLKGKKVVVGCPKLDDIEVYFEKLTQIIKYNDLKSITVAFMEVPCCMGIVKAVEKAIALSRKDIVLHKVRIGIEGDLIRL
ncbi:4Fe-4S ferredoxin [Crassaminicella thermophila]|uniref:4Fe-4S ferredoxin n=1 Tax=Crassaminicella thermophila TaxID=2599308 RepID=A0A5C0SCW6_CRATE|nr:4Fe-4S binding protein [Crassaminicella thermophila]QEK11054.1 4Fe-4S ferredoxin [Crassaminicella thermophila]